MSFQSSQDHNLGIHYRRSCNMALADHIPISSLPGCGLRSGVVRKHSYAASSRLT